MSWLLFWQIIGLSTWFAAMASMVVGAAAGKKGSS